MNIFYDDDANIEIIQKMKVSIVGLSLIHI